MNAQIAQWVKLNALGYVRPQPSALPSSLPARGADSGRQDPQSHLARRAEGTAEAHNVVIEDEAKAQQWVAASYDLDHQLGLLTHVLGETGARPSQAVRLKVRDLFTMAAPRLMMPKSGKGGTHPGRRKIEGYSVSISPELAALLKTAAKGRPSNAPLLRRKDGKPWNESNSCQDYRRAVREVVETIGLDPDEYGLYAFRHTSTTRMLLKGVHTSIVAKAHDTSEAMIQKYCAASIRDFTNEMTRKTCIPLAKR